MGPIGTALLSAVPAAIGAAGSIFGGRSAEQRQNDARREAENAAWMRNMATWGLETQYNHPKAQMKRLQEAGLNPNLIYGTPGSSAVGNAGTAPQAKAPDVRHSNHLAELAKYSNWTIAAAQTDNLREQTNTQKQQQILLAAQALKTGHEAGSAGVQKELAENLRGTNEAIRRHQLREQIAKGDYAEAEAEIRSKSIDDILKEVKYRAKGVVTDSEIKLLEKDVADFKSRMAEENLNPNDPSYVRQLAAFKEQILGWIGEYIEKAKFYSNPFRYNK